MLPQNGIHGRVLRDKCRKISGAGIPFETQSHRSGDFAAVVAGLEKLRYRQYHREPLSKALGNGLFELRHVGKLNTRILWFFRKGRRIIAVHGVRNKGQDIPRRDMDTARTRMRDWIKRNE
jgi:phage-related protein